MKMNNVTMHLSWLKKKWKYKRNFTNRARVIRKSVVRQHKITIQPNQFILLFIFSNFFRCRLTNNREKMNKQVTNTNYMLYTK